MASISIINMSLVTTWAEKKSLENRPYFRSLFPGEDNEAKCVQGKFSQYDYRGKKKESLAHPFIQNRCVFGDYGVFFFFLDYGVFMKYTKQLTI